MSLLMNTNTTKPGVVAERAELILILGEAGWKAADAQRLTLVRLRLEVLRLQEPWIFA